MKAILITLLAISALALASSETLSYIPSRELGYFDKPGCASVQSKYQGCVHPGHWMGKYMKWMLSGMPGRSGGGCPWVWYQSNEVPAANATHFRNEKSAFHSCMSGLAANLPAGCSYRDIYWAALDHAKTAPRDNNWGKGDGTDPNAPVAKPQPKPAPKPEPTPGTGGSAGGCSLRVDQKVSEHTVADVMKWNKMQLADHNKVRRKHGAKPLTLDCKIVQQAQTYAEKLARTKTFAHSSSSERPGCGENLAAAWPSTRLFNNQANATMMWYNEVKDYDFSKPGFSMKTGHFTQVVWKKTTKLGCGIAGPYGVCQYNPPGNYGNQYTTNVVKST